MLFDYVCDSQSLIILNFLPVLLCRFTLDDKKTKVSVNQYFWEKYNIGLKYTSLPPLQAGTDAKPIYLPMEVSCFRWGPQDYCTCIWLWSRLLILVFLVLQLCKIAGGQRYTKKLNERQVTALLRATCQRPSARENNIKQANNLSSTSLFLSFLILIFVVYMCTPPCLAL